MDISNPGESGSDHFRLYQAVSGDRIKLKHFIFGNYHIGSSLYTVKNRMIL